MTYLEINLKNLKHNIKNLKKLLKPSTCLAARFALESRRESRRAKFMAVVKANAYGHGMIECAKAAIKAGADWLGVVNLAEGLELRAKGIKTPILVMGYVEPRNFASAAKNNISVAVFNLEQLKHVTRYMLHVTSKLKIHLKIETGISRLGFSENDWPKLFKKLKKLPKNVIIEGIYSHFASVEEHDLNYAQKQINIFKNFIKLFESSSQLSALSPQPIWHMAASAATMILPESHFDMVRCGISIYGLWPSREIRKAFSRNLSTYQLINSSTDFLKPVLSYKTKIVQIKEVEKGDFIGYGCTYRAPKKMTIAVLPVGYYEGVDRGLSNLGEVLISGQKCPIVGRICMNMTVTDVTELKTQNSKLKIGEEVVLIGKQGVEEITVDDCANKLGTINYEITTRIPEHIERVYTK